MNKNSNLFLLIFLGITWSTFALFTKISASALPPYFVTFARLAIAATILYPACILQGLKLSFRKNFRRYLIVGFFNSALPFTLFSIAAKNLDSGILSILDGTVPMFEVLISFFILKKVVDRNASIGVLFGLIGIVITSYDSNMKIDLSWTYLGSVIATLVATSSYAAASLYINAKCKDIKPMAMATGSVIFAALIVSPSVFVTDFSVIDLKIASSLFGLGTLCTGIAYIFYFKLTAEESPRTAVSVVLLIPVFGTLIGASFLNEPITINKIIGCVTILISMKFILNLSRKNFFKSREAHIV